MLALPFPQIDPIAFEFGPLAVRWYGLAYFAGILLGWIYAKELAGNDRLWGGRRAPIAATDLDDFLLWATAGIILGGRLGYAVFYQPGHFLDDPASFFRLWQGGMSFHGGLLGTVAAMALFSWKRALPMLSLFDVVAAAAPIGLFFGRIANFINGELYGRPADVPWAMVFPAGGPEPRHPSQLYEAALEGVALFVLLLILTHGLRSLRRPGLTAAAFVALYGVARTIVEFFREPDPQLGFIAGPLTMGMLLSVPMVLVGLAAVAWSLRRPRTA